MSGFADKKELDEIAAWIPKGDFGVPNDIAYAMLFLASNEASYITGQTIVVDGGSTLPESQVVMDQFYKKQRLNGLWLTSSTDFNSAGRRFDSCIPCRGLYS